MASADELYDKDSAMQELDNLCFDDCDSQVLDARMQMYKSQYDSCAILPERFDIPLSEVRRIGNKTV